MMKTCCTSCRKEVFVLLFPRLSLSPHTSSADIYSLSLPDALPIYQPQHAAQDGSLFVARNLPARLRVGPNPLGQHVKKGAEVPRSEEHTSELQSRENLVCRLLLEIKKYQEIA